MRSIGWVRLTACMLMTLCAISAWAVSAQQEVLEIASWQRVLEQHQHEGGMDYAALQAERADLDAFIASLAAARAGDWPREDQIAFWCNAYNAVVVYHVLESYPQLSSVREVEGFFDEIRTSVAGRDLTLDEIESEARSLGDPRVHFAVVCASTSCPDLRGEPYVGSELDRQLEEDTQSFLADPNKGLRWEASQDTLYLSSIFKWYAGDFTGGSTVVAFFARGKILDWVRPHLPSALRSELAGRTPRVRYLEYDWTLNDRERPRDHSGQELGKARRQGEEDDESDEIRRGDHGRRAAEGRI